MSGSKWFVRSVSSVAVLVFAQSSALAQSAGGSGDSERRAYVSFGLSAPKVDDLNARLSASGYEKLSERVLTIGAGGHGMMNRWIFGFEGNLFVVRARASTIGSRQIERSITAGNVFANFGRVVVSRRTLSVYPLVGIGAGGMALKFTDRASVTFDEVLANPRQGTTARVSGLLLQAGIGVDRFVMLKRSDAGGRVIESGITIGVRAGYVFGPSQSDWKVLDSPASGGPDISITGPYVRVVIGGGGRSIR